MRKKVGLTTYIKVRLTQAEKDLLQKMSVSHGIDMSVYCRSVLVDQMTRDPKQREEMIAFQQQVVNLTEHVVRTRALLNADLVKRYGDNAGQVADLANELQAEWTGVEYAG